MKTNTVSEVIEEYVILENSTSLLYVTRDLYEVYLMCDKLQTCLCLGGL